MYQASPPTPPAKQKYPFTIREGISTAKKYHGVGFAVVASFEFLLPRNPHFGILLSRTEIVYAELVGGVVGEWVSSGRWKKGSLLIYNMKYLNIFYRSKQKRWNENDLRMMLRISDSWAVRRDTGGAWKIQETSLCLWFQETLIEFRFGYKFANDCNPLISNWIEAEQFPVLFYATPTLQQIL